MKYILSIALLACLLSCSDNKIDILLDNAQNLMWTKCDSSLKILEKIDVKQIESEEQMALYGLLITQAKYKNYIKLDNDSLILNSSLYYKNEDETKYGLSLYYLGATYQDMQYYDMAIEEYLNAEKVNSKIDNKKIVAFVYNNLGQLYCKQFFAEKSIDYFKKAEKLFIELKDRRQLGYMYGDMSHSYHMKLNYDSSLLISNKALEIAVSQNNRVQISKIYHNQASIYLYMDKINETKNAVNKSISYDSTNSNLNLIFAEIAIKEQKYDSALYFIQKNAPFKCLIDDKLYSEIYESKGDYESALKFYKKYNAQSDSIWDHREKTRIDEISARYDKEQLIKEKRNIVKSRTMWIWLVILSSILLGVVSIMLYCRNRQYISTYKGLIETLKGQQNNTVLIELLNLREVKLRSAIEKRLALIGELVTISYEYKDNDRAFINKFNEKLSNDPLNSEAFNDIIDVVNSGYNNIIDYLKENLKLSKLDLIICALTCVGFTPHQTFIILNTKTVNQIYYRKNKIGAKLGGTGDLKKTLDSIVSQISDQKIANILAIQDSVKI